MGGVIAPRGLDLAQQGATVEDLPEGVPVGCRVGDQPAVAIRRGEEVSAFDAACTHYGADLAQGRVVGQTLRCPWHHACFSLKTGQSNRAPALRDLGGWVVERQGDRYFARQRLQAPSPGRRVDAGSIVVIGAGAAGAAAVETLRAEGHQGDIIWIGREAPVDRPNLSKDYLAGTAPEEWIPLREEAFYAQQRIDARFGREAVAIDRSDQTVTLDQGERIRYDALILAPGAVPVRLPIPGMDLPHVHVLRTLADSRAIRKSAASARRAVVLGASFIGLEVAMSLRTLGLQVSVVAPHSLPLEQVLGPEIGAFLKGYYEARGVTFYLSRSAVAIGEQVALTDGTLLPADLVVAGVGVRPDVALARQAGLRIGSGIIVDAELRAAPNLFVAGDAARYPDAEGRFVRIEHWVAAMAQGGCAARNALGAHEAFRAVPFFWSAHGELTFAVTGEAGRFDRIDRLGSLEEGAAAFAFRERGRTRAIVTVGRDDLNLAAEEALARGDEEALAALVPPSADRWSPAAPADHEQQR